MKNKLIVNTDAPNEIHMTRTFDAPRHLVIEAMTKPELIKRWLGGKRATVTHAECDLRVGGSYKWVFLLPDGNSFYFSGTFREVSPERVVHNERFNEEPDESLVTSTSSMRILRNSIGLAPAFRTVRVAAGKILPEHTAVNSGSDAFEKYVVNERSWAFTFPTPAPPPTWVVPLLENPNE